MSNNPHTTRPCQKNAIPCCPSLARIPKTNPRCRCSRRASPRERRKGRLGLRRTMHSRKRGCFQNGPSVRNKNCFFLIRKEKFCQEEKVLITGSCKVCQDVKIKHARAVPIIKTTMHHHAQQPTTQPPTQHITHNTQHTTTQPHNQPHNQPTQPPTQRTIIRTMSGIPH